MGSAAVGSDPRLSSTRSVSSRAIPSASPPFGDAAIETCHPARPAVTAVGLGRWRPNEPERLPSDRPGSCDSGWLDHASCSRAQSHPAPCRSLRALHTDGTEAPSAALPASSKAGGSPRPISRLRREPTARERCVSPTSATDSLHEHQRIARFPIALPVPSPSFDGSLHGCVPARPGPKPSACVTRRAWEPAELPAERATRWTFA